MTTDIQKEVAEWALKNFGEQKSYRPLLGLVEEVGELSHAHLKSEQGIRINEDHHEAKIDAVGDILIYLLHYCALENIDLESTLIKTWNQVKQRDWTKKKVKGI